MADFRAHVEGLPAFTTRMQRAPQVIREELTRSVDRCTLMGEAESKRQVGVKTGHLRRSITATRATFAGGVARGMWGTNVPYARIHHDGRGPVVARPGGVLRFVVNGRVLYRKRVGPAKGNPFIREPARRLRPRFHAEFAACSRRIISRLSGGR